MWRYVVISVLLTGISVVCRTLWGWVPLWQFSAFAALVTLLVGIILRAPITRQSAQEITWQLVLFAGMGIGNAGVLLPSTIHSAENEEAQS
jgi:cyanate permease